MRVLNLLPAALAAALVLPGCADSASSPGRADPAVHRYGAIDFKPCTLTSPGSTMTVEARCGRLSVPENPAAPKGRRIELNIAWLPAKDESAPALDPVFYLAGGPGQAASEVWPQIDRAFAEVRKQRHVILVDQRGTGKSHPLVCRDTKGNSAVLDGEADSGAELTAFAQRCLASLDADPRFYTTTDAVRDLDTVRRALGAETINLVGGSYGTRVAQQYAKRHPQHTRTVLLDGVAPNTLVLGSEHARNLDASLELQFARCQALPACRDRFGADTRDQLRTLMTQLRANPVEVEYRDPTTGAMRRDTMTADTVGGLTRLFAYAPHAASLLPLVVNEASQGRHAPMMALAQMIQSQLSEQIMHGMQLSVMCAEDAPELRENPADEGTVLGNGLPKLAIEQCKVWPRGDRPSDFRAPLKSDVPALLLSGEFDPVTPPRYGDEVLKHLPNGRHLVVKGQGHIVADAGCMPKLMGQFLESANAKALDTKCLDSVGYVPPFTSFNGWEP